MNLFIFSSLILTSFYALFSSDLLMIWLMMEINNFIFMIFLLLFMKNKKMSFMYFFIQLNASSILLISILINLFLPPANLITTNIIMLLAICMKLGVPPLHFWVPEMSTHMKWKMIFPFFTIQKIIPFIFISIIHPHPSILSIFIILALIIPPIKMMNMSNLKKIFAFSSINQTGWMMAIISSMPSLWILYFIIYSLSILIIFIMISAKKIMSNSMIKSNMLFKTLTLSLAMNLAGLPPFSFFMMKWYSIFMLNVESKFNIMLILMLISSLMMMFIYINMIIKVSLSTLSYPKLLHSSFNSHLIQNKSSEIKIWMLIMIINLAFFIMLI